MTLPLFHLSFDSALGGQPTKKKKKKCKRNGKHHREEKIKRYEVVYRYLFTMVLESGWTNIMEWNL